MLQMLTSCSFLDFTQTQAARILKPSASLILFESGFFFSLKSFFRKKKFYVHGVFLSKQFDIDAGIQTLTKYSLRVRNNFRLQHKFQLWIIQIGISINKNSPINDLSKSIFIVYCTDKSNFVY